MRTRFARALGVAAVLMLTFGCTHSLATQQAPPAPVPDATKPSPLLDMLKPVVPSPAGDFAASGLEGVVLYTREGESKVFAARGKRARGLYWSPSGRWLLAITEGPSLWLVEPAAGRSTEVTQQFPALKDGTLSVSWAPDESEALVADGLLSNDPSTVWLFTPGTKSARKLTEATKLEKVQWLPGGRGDLWVGAGCCEPVHWVINLATGKLVPGEGWGGRGSYSPDGRLFMQEAYMGASLTIRDMVAGTSQVIWRNVPPGDPPPAEGVRYSLSSGLWSPDGRFFAYVVGISGTPSLTLRVVNAADGAQVRMVRDLAPATEQQWLPGGKGLLYANLHENSLVLHLEDRVVANHPAKVGWERAVLSPDGRLLAYVVYNQARDSELYVANLENGKAGAVSNSADLFPLMWNTDGSQLLVVEMPTTKHSLPGGGEAGGREATGLRWIRP